jgi:hypothetical protein
MRHLIKKALAKLPLLSNLHAKKQQLYENRADVENIDTVVRSLFKIGTKTPRVQPLDDTNEKRTPILSPPVIPCTVPDNDIKTMDSIEGMMQLCEVERLYELAGGSQKNILELGSLRGKSTVALLLGSEQNGNVVSAVDPFVTSECGRGGSTIVDGDVDYERFLANTEPWRERLVHYKMKSREVVWTNGEIDVCFIDAFHTYDEVKADFYHFYPYLSKDARVALHDYSPYKPVFPGVVKFVDELLGSGEWLWDDFRGALISVKRSPSSMDRAEVVRINDYMRGAHQKILECLDDYNTLQHEIQEFSKTMDEGRVYDGSGIILKGPFKPVGVNSFIAHIPQLAKLADTEPIQASPLMLFEDSAVLGPAHSVHEDIRNKGGGAYSHWGESLYFSTSDNSDPNLNGRNYWVLVKIGR